MSLDLSMFMRCANRDWGCDHCELSSHTQRYAFLLSSTGSDTANTELNLPKAMQWRGQLICVGKKKAKAEDGLDLNFWVSFFAWGVQARNFVF